MMVFPSKGSSPQRPVWAERLRLHALCLSLSVHAGVWSAEAVPDFGFPRCYTSFPNYDTAWEDDTASKEVRPLSGHQRFPYSGATQEMCAAGQSNDLQPPLVSLGPHWSPIGVTQYSFPPSRASQVVNALPAEFKDRLIVASHGSWNRSPWIGYGVQAYSYSATAASSGKSHEVDYQVSGQSTLLPPLRNSATGTRIRPVDVKPSPVDHALLMTADRDDLDVSAGRGGGLYRVVAASVPVASGATRISLDSTTNPGVNGGSVALDRLASIPCARQIAVSETNPALVYVSTLALFCPLKSGTGESVYVVEFEANESRVKRGPVEVVKNLNGPQGIDWVADGTNNTVTSTKLYLATNGNTVTQRGNCVLEIENIDMIALSILGANGAGVLDGTSDSRVVEVVCGFTRVQSQHHWRSLRVHPSKSFAIVSVGADCNWSETCHEDIQVQDYQTTLVRVELQDDVGGGKSKGAVSLAAKGIRNAIGLFYDSFGNLLFTHFGSDRAHGISGASSANNVPDCALEVLKLDSGIGGATTTTASVTEAARTDTGVTTTTASTTLREAGILSSTNLPKSTSAVGDETRRDESLSAHVDSTTTIATISTLISPGPLVIESFSTRRHWSAALPSYVLLVLSMWTRFFLPFLRGHY